jgi:hypothetical protein
MRPGNGEVLFCAAFSVYQIESGRQMEVLLNLAWLLLTAGMALLWVRFGVRRGVSRPAQGMALLVLLLVLFPVISVSDDLLALQNPAEADCCLRRVDAAVGAHSVLPAIAVLPQPPADEVRTDVHRLAATGERISSAEAQPGLAGIDNRPPPAA